jgi:hypothetical protein
MTQASGPDAAPAKQQPTVDQGPHLLRRRQDIRITACCFGQLQTASRSLDWPEPSRSAGSVLRESDSELTIDRWLGSRAARMQLTGPGCLGQPPVRSDCPASLVLANRRCAAARGLRLAFVPARGWGSRPRSWLCAIPAAPVPAPTRDGVRCLVQRLSVPVDGIRLLHLGRRKQPRVGELTDRFTPTGGGWARLSTGS